MSLRCKIGFDTAENGPYTVWVTNTQPTPETPSALPGSMSHVLSHILSHVLSHVLRHIRQGIQTVSMDPPCLELRFPTGIGSLLLTMCKLRAQSSSTPISSSSASTYVCSNFLSNFWRMFGKL